MAKLTTKAVEAIKPTEQRREIPDALLPGLYLVVQPKSGARSWAVRYRRGNRTRKHTLGTFPALDLKTARDLGAKALRAAAEGRDPAQEKRDQRTTGDIEQDLVAFQKGHLRKKNGGPIRETTRIERARLLGLKPDPENPGEWIATGNGVLKRWEGRSLASITEDDVRAAIKAAAKSGPILANRTLSALKTFFTWCTKDKRLAKSPCQGIDLPSPEAASDRYLSDDELGHVWKGAGQLDPIYGAMVKMLILTGQRRGEVAGMERAELDLKRRSWSLPSARTKNGRAHDVPLSSQAIAVIEAVPGTSERYVFSFNGNSPINGFGKPKDRLDALCGFSDWTLHDIRRTVASGMAKLGIALPVTEKVLNHVSGSFAGIVGVYQRHEYADEKRDALNEWGDHIAKLAKKGNRGGE